MTTLQETAEFIRSYVSDNYPVSVTQSGLRIIFEEPNLVYKTKAVQVMVSAELEDRSLYSSVLIGVPFHIWRCGEERTRAYLKEKLVRAAHIVTILFESGEYQSENGESFIQI